MSATEIDIRDGWTCPDCDSRLAAMHTFNDAAAPGPVRRQAVVRWEAECAQGHRHRLPEDAVLVWPMTPEESAAIEAAQRETQEARERAASEFKASIEGRTIVGYERIRRDPAASDWDADTDAVVLRLDDGSVLRIEAGGYDDPYLSARLLDNDKSPGDT